MKHIVTFLALALCASTMVAQTPSPGDSSTATSPAPTSSAPVSASGTTGSNQAADPVAKPYGADEFPEWAEDLRRFDVITIGSWPLSFLFSSIAYDVGRWAHLSSTEPERASQYAPLLFSPPNKPANTIEETQTIIYISIGLSLGIGITDYIIGQIKRQEEADRLERLRVDLLENSVIRDGGTPETEEQP